MNQQELEQALKAKLEQFEKLDKKEGALFLFDIDKVLQLAVSLERITVDAIESGKIKQLSGVKNTTRRIAAFKMLDAVIKEAKKDPSKIAVAIIAIRDLLDVIVKYIGANENVSIQAIESNSSVRT